MNHPAECMPIIPVNLPEDSGRSARSGLAVLGVLVACFVVLLVAAGIAEGFEMATNFLAGDR